MFITNAMTDPTCNLLQMLDRINRVVSYAEGDDKETLRFVHDTIKPEDEETFFLAWMAYRLRELPPPTKTPYNGMLRRTHKEGDIPFRFPCNEVSGEVEAR